MELEDKVGIALLLIIALYLITAPVLTKYRHTHRSIPWLTEAPWQKK